MNASEFNTEITKLTNRALREGLMKGKITAAELIGVLELNKSAATTTMMNILASQAQQQAPIIHLPPNGRLPEFPPQG